MKKNAHNILYLALIGFFILGCGRFTKTQQQIEQDRKIEERSARADIFDKRPDLLEELSREPTKESLTDKPYLNGKIVLLENDGNRYKPYRNLSEEFDAQLGSSYATDPTNIQTVVLIKEEKVDGGTYVDANGKPRARGVGFSCKVTIIDRTIGAVIFRKKFEPTFLDTAKVYTSPGDHPSVSAHNSPELEAIDFLERLEKR
ncbi:MAG TPA: hypothetical protein VMZ26_17235 [Pyrinomonadaceae bacterium]|nr:hypothetical protein [Pyrinomonadaceae bacterium]